MEIMHVLRLRLLVTIVYLLFTFSCSEAQQKSSKKHDTLKTIVPAPADFDAEGFWVMTNYFDSIIKNKTVTGYRKLFASWFAIAIEIKGDSIKAFGSIITNKKFSVMNSNSDTLFVFGKTARGEYALYKNYTSGRLELVQTGNEKDEQDSIKYIFENRPDLRYLIENSENEGFSKNITSYFNEHLLAGAYLAEVKAVTFLSNGIVTGFQNYTTYEVRNYFGTSHPFKNRDVVILKGKGVEDYWEWKFENDTLVLTKMSVDWHVTDDYDLTNESYRLKKQ
ncbi:MAG: hypothetical protein M3R17_18235 [Bacteroidota bacterium]|nr:hypothetical protein [Bacteroidota bacterium]